MPTDTVEADALFEPPPPVNPAVIATLDRSGPAGQPAEPAPTGEPAPETVTDGPATDGAGMPFDPSRHLPVKHPRTDRWMPRRPAKTAAGAGPGTVPPVDTGSFVAPDEPTGEPTPETGGPTGGPAEPAASDVCNVMADLHCRAFYGVAVAFLSDEWLATKDEHKTNVETLAAYYRATGLRPDSPGIALLAQATAFAGKRLSMPKTQTRLGAFKSWLTRKMEAWRGARRSKELRAVS